MPTGALWATPEKAALWKELIAAGADLINTDKLDELQRFLRDSSEVGPGR